MYLLLRDMFHYFHTTKMRLQLKAYWVPSNIQYRKVLGLHRLDQPSITKVTNNNNDKFYLPEIKHKAKKIIG